MTIYHNHHIIPKHSKETKKKISDKHKGKKLTDEHKEILRKTHLGKKKSIEQRQKMSEAAKKLWQKRTLERGELFPR